jgi:serine/threonine protein kinase
MIGASRIAIPPQAMLRAVQTCVIVSEGADLQISDRGVLPYRVIRNLGMGGCATVEMVKDITTGRTFAHKLFRKYRGPNLGKFKQEVENEIMIMRRLSSHPHIIRLFATYSCGRDFGLILTPVADSGDLATYLLGISDSGNPLTAEQSAVLVRAYGCLASGLAYIHQHTIRHKDIKPQNILVHQGRVIYTDFGIAFDGSYLDNTTTTGPPNAFTRRYCAPEVASWAKRNRKSDIFSLGCVYIELLTVLEPSFYTELLEAPIYFEIARELRINLNDKCTHASHWNSLVSVCLDMMEPDIDQRIDISELLTRFHASKPPEAISITGFFCALCCKDL